MNLIIRYHPIKVSQKLVSILINIYNLGKLYSAICKNLYPLMLYPKKHLNHIYIYSLKEVLIFIMILVIIVLFIFQGGILFKFLLMDLYSSQDCNKEDGQMLIRWLSGHCVYLLESKIYKMLNKKMRKTRKRKIWKRPFK